MLKKGFYDLLTLLFILLVIGVMVLSSSLMNTFVEDQMAGEQEREIVTFPNGSVNMQAEMQQTFESMAVIQMYMMLFNLFVSAIIFGYYIFILVLAIQLHKRKYVGTANLIFIIIFVPFAFIYYLTYLRGKLKKALVEGGATQQNPQVIAPA